MGRWIRRIVLGVFGLALAAYLGLAAYMFAIQRELLFRRTPRMLPALSRLCGC